MRKHSGVILVVTSAVSYGTLALLVRLAQEPGMNNSTILFLRFTMASLVMLAVLAGTGRRLPKLQDAGGFALLGAVYVGQGMCFFSAVALVETNLASLMLYLYPVLVTLMAWLFLRERLTAVKLGCLAAALIGCILTVGAAGNPDPVGLALGAGSALFYSAYIILATRFLQRGDFLASSTVVMISAAAIFGIWAAIEGITLPATTKSWLAIGGIALVATVLAMTTMFAGLKRIGPVNTSTLSALEPAVTVLLGVLLLGEEMSVLKGLGAVLILGATVVLARSKASEDVQGTAFRS